MSPTFIKGNPISHQSVWVMTIIKRYEIDTFYILITGIMFLTFTAVHPTQDCFPFFTVFTDIHRSMVVGMPKSANSDKMIPDAQNRRMAEISSICPLVVVYNRSVMYW